MESSIARGGRPPQVGSGFEALNRAWSQYGEQHSQGRKTPGSSLLAELAIQLLRSVPHLISRSQSQVIKPFSKSSPGCRGRRLAGLWAKPLFQQGYFPGLRRMTTSTLMIHPKQESLQIICLTSSSIWVCPVWQRFDEPFSERKVCNFKCVNL